MSVLVSCGHRYGGGRAFFEYLVKIGLKDAKPTSSHLLPCALLSKIKSAYKVNEREAGDYSFVQLSKVWEVLVADLVLENLDSHHWGWWNSDNIYVLDFLKDFDPEFQFLLIYSRPEKAIAPLLLNEKPDNEIVHQTIANWCGYSEQLLHFYNRNQERCLLVSADMPRVEFYRFLRLCDERLGLQDLRDNNYAAPVINSDDPIPDLLSGLLTKDHSQALTLYQELEVTADMPANQEILIQDQIELAWEALAASFKQMTRFHENDGKTQNAYGGGTVESLEDNQEGKNFSSQLRQVHEKLEQTSLTVESQKKEIDHTKRLLSEDRKQQEQLLSESREQRQQKDQEIGILRQQIVALEDEVKNLTPKLDRPAENSAKLREAEQENELLLLQLRQVQEELEHYFQKCQELAQSEKENEQDRSSENTSSIPAESVPSVPSAPSAPVMIDMRHYIEGSNWYDAEHDGRWAGPGTNAKIALPILSEGYHQIKIDIVDAMAQEIVQNMTLSFGDNPIQINKRKCRVDLKGHLAPLKRLYTVLFRRHRSFPMQVVGGFYVSKEEAQSHGSLIFDFPKTLSPRRRDEMDMRELAVRIHQIEIS